MNIFPERHILRYTSVGSTHEEACKLVDNGKDTDGLMISASFQTHGIGQENNSWFSDAGRNLLLSYIWYTDTIPADRQFILSKAVSLGILDTLRKKIPPELPPLTIKWPNDIYVGHQKIAGILIRNQIQGSHLTKSVVSIGLNVNQNTFPGWVPNPTSLFLITGNTYDITELEAELTFALNTRFHSLRSGVVELIHTAYLQSLYLFNIDRPYTYKSRKIIARITGVNEFGHLMLIDREGKQIVCDLKEIAFAVKDQE